MYLHYLSNSREVLTSFTLINVYECAQMDIKWKICILWAWFVTCEIMNRFQQIHISDEVLILSR